MKTFQIDLLNTGLIILSLVLAFLLPFELFLFAYAILGPLHYFTEINWIRDQKYFTTSKIWLYMVLISAVMLSLPPLLRLPFFDDYQENTFMEFITYDLPPYLNACLFISIVGALAFTVVKKTSLQYIILGVGIVLAILFHFYPIYHLVIGILLPTVIHVYVFTIFFMWYGSLKTKSKLDYVNIIILVLIPFLIAFISFNQLNYFVSDSIKEIYADNSFYILNAKLSNVIGLTDGSRFSFEELLFVKIQIFIAFAYTYHYLNWFSKTTVIGWHKKLTQRRSIIIVLLWIASMALYFYNYKIGFTLLLFLSFVHVFMEFPLNVISIRGIGKAVFQKKS